MVTTVTRYHDISTGHRVVNQGGKCENLHGHNYRIHFTVEAPGLDNVGRVLDFSVVKDKLCMWLEDNWDHVFLVWEHDPLWDALTHLDPTCKTVSFNPTAENMGAYLIHIAAVLLEGTGCTLVEVRVEETRKCSATVKLPRAYYDQQ